MKMFSLFVSLSSRVGVCRVFLEQRDVRAFREKRSKTLFVFSLKNLSRLSFVVS